MDPMLPSSNRGRKRGHESPWRGGQNWRGSNTTERQQFPSPYQDVRNNTLGWSEPRQSYSRGAQHQQQASRWQNRRSFATPRGHPGDSYNNKNQQPQEVNIRDYVVPAMTGNPWKHLEEQWNAEHSSV